MVYLKSESKFFTSGEILSTIGIDSFRRIAEDLEFPKATFSAAMGSGVWTVSITTPGDFIKIDKTKDVVFTDATNIRKLHPKTHVKWFAALSARFFLLTHLDYSGFVKSKISIRIPAFKGVHTTINYKRVR